MKEFSDQEQPTGDIPDFSDDEALESPQSEFQHQSSRHGSAFSTMGSSNMAHIANIDRNEYSDEDIKIVYEVVVRAETILAEELTPSSRLPTHALFLAYDEILAEYGLDPSERHISKLVFMVGGVKGQKSLMDKFKSVMTRMNITLAIEEPQGFGNEHEYREGNRLGSDTEDLRTIDDEYTSNARISRAESDYVPAFSTEPLDIAKERHLADKAEAFGKRHRAQFAIATLRRWHNTAYHVSYLRAQLDATDEAELREALEEKFHIWKALATEAAQAAPNNVPPNVYSKRTERIAIRAYEILATKKALIKWRHSTQDEYRKSRDAKLLADQLARQEYEDYDFKENPELARLAQRAHRNLVLSKAFTTWSNRAEEEDAKAEVATKAYEMNLKVKALGLARNRSALDDMRNLLASKTSGAVDSSVSQAVASDGRQPGSLAPAVTKPASAAPIPSRPRPPSERPLSSVAIATQLQTRSLTKNQPTFSTVQPSTATPIATVPSTATSVDGIGAGTRTSASPAEAVLANNPTRDADTSNDDQLDERTMLARRHILRMRYFGAWERYTSDNTAKVEQFGQEIQNQRVARSVFTWRTQSASQQQQASECNVEFEETRSYRRVAQTVSKWRKKAGQEAPRRENILEHYAERAEYYQKTTKALPVLREKTEQAGQKEKLLELYAERTNYYLRTTQALSIWRERGRVISRQHQLQDNYGERANYYHRARSTLSAWQQRTKQRRKERLKEAHLETRRIVKKNMGERCIKQWRNKLEPSYQRYEIMNVVLVDALEDREWRQASKAFTIWRHRAQELSEAAATGDAMLKQKAMEKWREKATLHTDLEAEAREHWEIRAMSRALKNWNLGSLQGANRPEMVANALEKKERRLIRQGFETWYGRTADKLVPVELPDGTYRNVGQVVEGAQQQAIKHQARGLLHTWKAAAADSRASQVRDEPYAPTPGRPQLFLGSFNRRETTTPLAPVPSYARWQGRDSMMGRSEFGARVGRSERTKNPKNLRVSWAA
ncbi:hypothetical protein E0Z10_g2720 [Xylaria hypoxylon]|uniref:Sfi1 spindle body domain-containing protein n=1 Tax=Xylaria hypoxylon TaxID=37992 RepID=A0A4Z0Z1H1_9PEZI|nr:hypothetical protein E0Z10_g2720 [Xylaria hypoxylon]